MAKSASKHRAKEMKRLGWVWAPGANAWLYLSYNQQFLFDIEYRGKRWQADRYMDGTPTVFDCPIAAAIWISVEYADEIAADKERSERGWQEHFGYSLPA